jgi:hypothetical protein
MWMRENLRLIFVLLYFLCRGATSSAQEAGIEAPHP